MRICLCNLNVKRTDIREKKRATKTNYIYIITNIIINIDVSYLESIYKHSHHEVPYYIYTYQYIAENLFRHIQHAIIDLSIQN